MLAVPLGGNQATAFDQAHPEHHEDPPQVHHLSAADGREVHTINGLSWPRPADLDGDGLEDLWGSVDGKLRAYRGEATEAWRVLGRYHKAGDLDGDGIADTLIGDLRAPGASARRTTGSHTALARSGNAVRDFLPSKLGFC